ncbi:MAG: aldehyde dehydrogenase [Lachnospiraceae bacterium]|nr:aldehyde dehydrogenase [Lachnospiraceae bacterium]
MTETEIKQIVDTQRNYFNTGATLPIAKRIAALQNLKAAILAHEEEIIEAVHADLGKSANESYMCEMGLVLSEITYMIKHIRSFSKEKTVYTPIAQFHSRSYKKPSPYGVVLIISPWNYPFMLTFDPLVDAIAAGNTVVIKPSAYSPNTGRVIEKVVKACFTPELVSVVTGGRAENVSLLNQEFDYIFFTGSQAVGKDVMRHAAEHLTPVTLELGGKSPCIVDSTANIKLAAKRIVFGKFLNCGQTCVAPDYIYCHESVKDKLIQELTTQIKAQFGEDPLTNTAYGKIINEKHFNRLSGLITPEKIIYGGKTAPDSLKIEPTLLSSVTFEDAVMQEEIFGPILPILTWKTQEEVIAKMNLLPHPLALYLFSSDKKFIRQVTSRCGYGGGCINDTIIHLATSEMGFGGFGASGMGSYHGKDGFDTFSHYKSMVDKKTWLDLPMRYQPYTNLNSKLIRFFLR